MIINENGIYTITDKIYHADPCPAPSASRSFLQTLIARTPLHAMMEHPRLNPNYQSDDNKKFDFGSAAHDYFLEGGGKVVVLPFDDYRTKAAQAERDSAIAMDKMPVLQEKFADIEAMAVAAKKQIACHADFPNAFAAGKAEQSIIWQEDGLWFRARPDFINDDGWIDDYKTTDIAGPEQWMNGVFVDSGYDLQAYMALRGYKKVTGNDAKGFRFWVQEKEAPHMIFCVVASDLSLEMAQQKFFFGKKIFEKCMKAQAWPGYSNKAYVAYPGFRAEKMYENIKQVEQKIDENEGDLFKLMMDWQKPIAA